ncbi:MAG: c-type cytochrome [SAR324 cluster bacterium]|nr:c-type cytochrome [SAR324 cluster bacterium]
MAQEEKVLDHSFDGIQEYDNPLPRWWVWLFYLTIIFGVVYFPYYHFFGGVLPVEEHNKEVAIVAKMRAEKQKAAEAAALQSSAASTTASAAPAAQSSNTDSGKSIYLTNCVACHGQLGEGGIGPNLTDDYWLHGNTEADLTKIVTNGVLEKGMIAWKTVLSPSKIRDVVAYVQTLKGTNPPNPKAPQGEKY